MAEALFYHLTAQRLEKALPGLVEKTLERGQRAVIRAGNPERIEALDLLLWTYRDDSFLPHGTSGTASPQRQPVFLTATDDMPNTPDVLFLVDMADTADFGGVARTVVMFDESDDAAKDFARGQWLRAKDQVSATYWKQDPDGRWIKAASSNPGGD